MTVLEKNTFFGLEIIHGNLENTKVLQGWSSGFGLLPGSQCRVWCEERSKWLPSCVVAVADEARKNSS